MKKRILITGASGRIGQLLTKQFGDKYELVLTDVKAREVELGITVALANLVEMEEIRPLFQNIHTVIHLGADYRQEAPWESLLPNNIVATYNVLQLAHEARCKRIIFASSINAGLGYPNGSNVTVDMPINPPNLYGATKVWGEAVGRFYAEQHGLSCFCLRLGWVTSGRYLVNRENSDIFNIVLTHRDLVHFMELAVEAPPEVHYEVFHVLSNNRHNYLDISESCRILGYNPQDDAYEISEQNALKGIET